MKPNRSSANIIRFPTEDLVCATMFVAPMNPFAKVKAFAVPVSVRVLNSLERRIDLVAQLGREESVDSVAWREFTEPASLVAGAKHPLVRETILDLQDNPFLVTEATEEFEHFNAEDGELIMAVGGDSITWIACLGDESIHSAPVTNADLSSVRRSRFMLGRDRRNGRGCR